MDIVHYKMVARDTNNQVVLKKWKEAKANYKHT